MLNSLFIFVLKLNNKEVTDGSYFLVVIEFLCVTLMYFIFRST